MAAGCFCLVLTLHVAASEPRPDGHIIQVYTVNRDWVPSAPARIRTLQKTTDFSPESWEVHRTAGPPQTRTADVKENSTCQSCQFGAERRQAGFRSSGVSVHEGDKT